MIELVTQVVEKADKLSMVFSPGFTSKCFSHTTHVAADESRDWGDKELPAVGEIQV